MTSRATRLPNHLKIKVGVLLQRKPLQIPPLEGFPLAYHSWREARTLSESRPFEPKFYYKKGSFAEKRFLQAQDENPGVLVQPYEDLNQGEEAAAPIYKIPLGSKKSLDRSPLKSLYLFLKTHNGYRLPEGELVESSLHESAPKILQTCIGDKNETWVIGRVPVGMLPPSVDKDSSPEKKTVIYEA